MTSKKWPVCQATQAWARRQRKQASSSGWPAVRYRDTPDCHRVSMHPCWTCLLAANGVAPALLRHSIRRRDRYSRFHRPRCVFHPLRIVTKQQHRRDRLPARSRACATLDHAQDSIERPVLNNATLRLCLDSVLPASAARRKRNQHRASCSLAPSITLAAPLNSRRQHLSRIAPRSPDNLISAAPIVGAKKPQRAMCSARARSKN
jgi:hypothetical protein